MKRLRYLLVILSVLLIVNCVQALANPNQDLIRCDTAILNKRQVSKDLVQLRDSIATSILNIQQKVDKQKPDNQQQLSKALNELKLQKSEIEKAIEELVSLNDQAWDDTQENRTLIQFDERRREYHRTLNDIKNITNTKDYQ